MKRIALLTCMFLLLVFSFSYSQSEEGAYLNIDYLKVDPVNFSAFEELVNSEWESIYENEIGSDKITGWYFYRVVYPGGQASDYNYVTISSYKDLNTIVAMNEKLRERLANFEEDIMGKTLDLAKHQYSELWKIEAGIMAASDKSPGTFMVMNYMMVNPGKEAEYLTLENDMARPLHQERISKGDMHSWRTYSLLKPGGLDYNYNFATADYYEELEDIEFGFTNELIKSVMPGTNINEMFDAIYSTREIVRSELWQLVDYLE